MLILSSACETEETKRDAEGSCKSCEGYVVFGSSALCDAQRRDALQVSFGCQASPPQAPQYS